LGIVFHSDPLAKRVRERRTGSSSPPSNRKKCTFPSTSPAMNMLGFTGAQTVMRRLRNSWQSLCRILDPTPSASGHKRPRGRAGPSPSTASAVTAPLWPKRVRSSWPPSRSHTFSVWSDDRPLQIQITVGGSPTVGISSSVGLPPTASMGEPPTPFRGQHLQNHGGRYVHAF
jgi:hypothetical protein